VLHKQRRGAAHRLRVWQAEDMTSPDYVPLDERAQALFDSTEYATVATLEPGGQPQLSVVWVARDGDRAIFSTTRGRRKTENLERDPRCTLLIFPRAEPYTYLELRGTVEIEDDPASALIEQLSLKYTGNSYTSDAPGTRRVIVRLNPYKLLWH